MKTKYLLLIILAVITACQQAPATPLSLPIATEPSPPTAIAISPPTATNLPLPTVTPVVLPKMRYASFSVYDSVYIAKELGYFADAGVEVEIVGKNFGGPTAIQAVASGRAEAGLSAYMSIINAVAAGLPIKAAVELQTELPDSPKEIMLTRCADGYKTVKSLKGKTIAINNIKASFHYTWLMALQQNDMAEDSVIFVNLPFSAQPEALSKGDVQAAGIIEPFATLAEKAYPDKFCRLFTGGDIFGNRQFVATFINSIWARENPEVAEAFITAQKRAQVWSNANSAQSKAIIGKALGIENVNNMSDYKFAADGSINPEDVKYWLNFMVSNKHISVDYLTVEDLVWTKPK